MVYQLSYTATSGPIQTTTLLFTLPVFEPAGIYAVSPAVTMTDGSSTWSFTQVALQVNGGQFCFDLGTSGVDLTPTCGDNNLTGANSGVLITGFNGAIPTAPGTYGPQTGQQFFGFNNSNAFTAGVGSVTLNVSSVPEPATVAVATPALLLLALGLRRGAGRQAC